MIVEKKRAVHDDTLYICLYPRISIILSRRPTEYNKLIIVRH